MTSLEKGNLFAPRARRSTQTAPHDDAVPAMVPPPASDDVSCRQFHTAIHW